ncbi:MAG: hypothetical protein WC117_01145 [Sphaerochaetaceae bacterium]
MKQYTLPCIGARPMRFTGDHIASSTSKRTEGPCSSRWYDLDLYQTSSESGDYYVLAINYETNWQGEEGIYTAEVCETADHVAERLQEIRPDQNVTGYPLGKQYEEKQKRLIKAMETALGNAISDLLTTLPEEI